MKTRDEDMKELAIINPENVSKEEAGTYPVRKAARAVVFDGERNVALLYVSKKNYYKLPGGGLENSEDIFAALKRECMEEIGCDIDVRGEIGTIVEYRKIVNLTQISHCYFANVKGEKGEPHFDEGEKAEGFEPVWLPYEEALQRISENKVADFEGRAYIVPRDILFLTEAGKYNV